MYLDTNRVHEFYTRYSCEQEMFSNLNSEQLTICRRYFLQITKYKAESIENSAIIVNGFAYIGSICNLNDTIKCENENGEHSLDYIGYILTNMSTGRELRVSESYMCKLMYGRHTMIKALTDSTLVELKYCAYLCITNNTGDYIRNKSSRLALVLDSKDVNDRFMLLYKDLYTSYIALPTFLLERFNSKLDVDYRRIVFNNYMSLFLKDLSCIKNYEHILTEYARTIIVNSAEHEERLQYAELVAEYAKAYIKISRSGRIDLMQLVKAGMQQVYYVHTKDGNERLATKNEKQLLVSACFKKNVYFIPEEKLKLIKLFVWAHTGKFELLNSSGYDVSDYLGKKAVEANNYTFILNKNIVNDIKDSIAYLLSDEFLQVDVIELLKGVKPIEYLDSAEDEIKDLGLKVKLETIKSKCGNSNNEFIKMAYDIAFKALKFDNMVLSPKQMKVINTTYEQMQNEAVNNMYSKELEETIEKIEEFNRYKKGTFMYKLIGSIRDSKRCSVKQYNLIAVEFDKIKDIIDTTVDSIDTDDIDEDTKLYKTVRDNLRNENYSFIKEDRPGDTGWKGSWGSNGSIIPDISLNDIFAKE